LLYDLADDALTVVIGGQFFWRGGWQVFKPPLRLNEKTCLLAEVGKTTGVLLVRGGRQEKGDRTGGLEVVERRTEDGRIL
jgi:hypothetical protein